VSIYKEGDAKVNNPNKKPPNQLPQRGTGSAKKPPSKAALIRSLILSLIGLALVIGLLYWWNNRDTSNPTNISAEQFRVMVTENKIQHVEFFNSRGRIIKVDSEYKLTDKNRIEEHDYYITYFSNAAMLTLIGYIDAHNAEKERLLNSSNPDEVLAGEAMVQINWRDFPPPNNWWVSYIPLLIIILIGVGAIYFLFRMMNKQQGSALNFGKSKFRLGANKKVMFNEVAGADEEKEELREAVEFLKAPDKFTKLGARIPKGFLLVGPPGTGKTLLARAVAGEADVPFFSISGSDFVEMFVGVGASRVRDLFNQAKKAANIGKGCIVFIDEIDAVGRKRGAGLGGGNDEREQTLNQLLIEMDGFETNSGIIVMAATNRADVLDPALLRAGRFDRKVHVNRPDIKGREEILKVHARNKPMSKDVDFKTIARITTGLVGADLEVLLNEAAIVAAKANRPMIVQKDITDSVMKVALGPQKRSKVVSDEDKKLVAFHESGHAITARARGEEVQEVSIVPRGGAGGYTYSREEKESDYKTRTKMINQMIIYMGGRAAEMIQFGEISTGASGDIQAATNIAQAMVKHYGMSDLGPINFGGDDEIFVGRDFTARKGYSEKTAGDIDAAVGKLVNDALNEAVKILKANKKVLDNMAALLLERETILTEEVNLLMEGKNIKEIQEFITKRDEEFKKQQKENERLAMEFHKEQERKFLEERAKLAAKFLESNGYIDIVEPSKKINDEIVDKLVEENVKIEEEIKEIKEELKKRKETAKTEKKPTEKKKPAEKKDEDKK